ncbi:hypothetical protein M441DRAFT_48249 [Trichoderma asperellum CBS 433.97]|uniref:Uncharacterized protein n=1 Tax=Trichoderma asperellum (strain ATCC 204424 / CBS 433.97 / NBRC 101777) TaxID=1042311 RepID=A0A2T3Z6H4_TRIA4|nr:hypothetical protein M441DRAFT_48249 [Trichoderma asperellum CBS 433.97]PTB40408.1 hypothetical protein M441DRAFT_48249 [Trichoderma asperellum CBS 433.97]
MDTKQQDGGRLSVYNDPTPETVTALDHFTKENLPLNDKAKTRLGTMANPTASDQKEIQRQATNFIGEYIDLTIEMQNCLCGESLDKPQHRMGGSLICSECAQRYKDEVKQQYHWKSCLMCWSNWHELRIKLQYTDCVLGHAYCIRCWNKFVKSKGKKERRVQPGWIQCPTCRKTIKKELEPSVVRQIGIKRYYKRQI